MTDQPPPSNVDQLASPNFDPATSPFAAPPAPPAPRRRHLARTLVIVAILVVVVVGGGVVAAVLFGLRSASTVTDHVFTSKKFGYSMTLPGTPSVTERTTSSGTPAERVQVNAPGHVLTMEAEQLTVTVPTDRVGTVFSAALTASSTDLKGTNARQVKSFSWDGAPARSEVIDTPTLGTAYEVVALKGRTFFVLIISHETPAFNRAITSSFRVTG